MDEVKPESAEHACGANRTCRLRVRTIWLLVLVSVLGVGLLMVVAWYADVGGLASRRVNARNRERAWVTKHALRQLHTAVGQFRLEWGRWPTQAEGLSVLVRRPADVTNWPPGGFLDITELPKDGWGRDFIFELHPGARVRFLIKSLGADGVAGGEGYNADLVSSDAY